MSLIAGRNVHLYGIAAPFVLAGAFEKEILPTLLLRLENSLSKIEISFGGIDGLILARCLIYALHIAAGTSVHRIYRGE